MDITKLSKKMLHVLLHKHLAQSLSFAESGDEVKAKEHDNIAELISKELQSRV